MATHSSIIAWNPVDRGAWQAAAHGSQESDTTQWLKHHVRSLVLSVYLSMHTVHIWNVSTSGKYYQGWTYKIAYSIDSKISTW